MALPGCFAELLANFLADFAADILKIPSPSKKSALKSVHNFACTAGQEIRVPKQKTLPRDAAPTSGVQNMRLPRFTHRPQSSSFLGLPYRILNMNPEKGTTLGPMGIRAS